jgi:hypothetical protein
MPARDARRCGRDRSVLKREAGAPQRALDMISEVSSVARWIEDPHCRICAARSGARDLSDRDVVAQVQSVEFEQVAVAPMPHSGGEVVLELADRRRYFWAG